MPTFMRNLWLTSPMMRGADVAQAQAQLVKLGSKLVSDGLFGRATSDAVVDFQTHNRALVADGVLGRQTWAMLFGETAPVLPDRTASDILSADQLTRLTQPHRYFSSSELWRLSRDGVTLQNEANASCTDADHAQALKVFTEQKEALATILSKVAVPIELVIACICAESGGRVKAERREPGCSKVDPALTPGRVSVGLMQTLLGTARDALRRPALAPDDLCDPLISIEAGATYIWRQARLTGFDPPLVAAAYNAGGLRFNDSPTNRWKLVQYPIGTSAHVDRFVGAFNAAMRLDDIATLNASLGNRLPSLRNLLP
ncbi:transglycosylase-like protein with SLT domain [Paraburkholderia sp. BL27I4N3]|uniref:peptidoglycan-binding protein n=1 Tax=Paraburkholderia sp. BL27I4N3 TaxID=1938805 RepID=UPI000E397E25|nr:peptidoglycan-binding protein [Paraburkholderia sp. BL27I4N3]REE22149.1 transglycosylase-like protein with SLT domain [Paraburkholderia sp. BL27I4N3]